MYPNAGISALFTNIYSNKVHASLKLCKLLLFILISVFPDAPTMNAFKCNFNKGKVNLLFVKQFNRDLFVNLDSVVATYL